MKVSVVGLPVVGVKVIEAAPFLTASSTAWTPPSLTTLTANPVPFHLPVEPAVHRIHVPIGTAEPAGNL